MGKKMKLPLVFKSTEAHSSSSSSSSFWPWANCTNPKTLSFRTNDNSHIFNTMNTVYINTPDSSYSSISSETNKEGNGDVEEESLEIVIKGLSSERFFVEASGETSSILEEANDKKAIGDVALLQESVAMEIESRDPFVDFRSSMEEMVEASDESLKENWDFLEELLACYLKVNDKSNYGYIVGAFVDLFVGTEFASSSKTHSLTSCIISEDWGGYSFTSPLSFYSSASSTSPCLSSLMESEFEIEKLAEIDSKSSSMNLYNV